jgi:hypothetical protein
MKEKSQSKIIITDGTISASVDTMEQAKMVLKMMVAMGHKGFRIEVQEKIDSENADDQIESNLN